MHALLFYSQTVVARFFSKLPPPPRFHFGPFHFFAEITSPRHYAQTTIRTHILQATRHHALHVLFYFCLTNLNDRPRRRLVRI